MNKVIHFELSSEKPEESAVFFRSVFEWEINNRGGPIDYWLISGGKPDDPGINGAIKRKAPESQPTVVTIDVPSIDETINRILDAGGKILVEKTVIPGIGYHAYAMAPDGLIFGILQCKEPAA